MGRIKELFIQMQQEDYNGNPDAYMKKYVEELEDIPCEEQELIYNNIELIDEKKLYEYDIQNNCNICQRL